MRILVTGGAGFIGQRVVARLTAGGNSVTSFDLCGTGFGADLFGDVRDVDQLVAAITLGHDVVVHLAAIAGVRPSLGEPGRYVDSNVYGTAMVLRACELAAVKRVVLASSSSVFGNCEAAADEDRRFAPLSPYGASKVAAEALAQSYALRGLFEIAVLRPFTVYGPGQRPDMAFSRLFDDVIEGRQSELWRFTRDFTYVDDVVDGIVGAVAAPLVQPFRAFNLGSGAPVDAEFLAASIAEVTSQEFTPSWGAARAGEPRRTHADPTRARLEIGFTGTTPFLTGLTAQWEAHLAARTHVAVAS